MIEALIERLTPTKIDKNLLSYLNLIITQNAIIPKRFFVLFELSRFKFENGVIM